MMEWQDISTAPKDGYSVSSGGDIAFKNRLVHGWISSKGYRKVQIGGKHISIHRLVAVAFIPNPNNYPEINHIDGVKTNNAARNLEWCDRSHNMRHCYKMGLHPGVILRGKDSPNYGRNGSRHPQSMAVRAIFKDGTCKDYESQRLAEKDGYSSAKISSCINGHRKTHGGANWMPLPLPPPENKG